MISATVKSSANAECALCTALVFPLPVQAWRDACGVDEERDADGDMHGSDGTPGAGEWLCQTS